MEVSFPAPRLCQFDDQEAVLAIGEIICPGVVMRDQWDPNGLRVWIDGDPASVDSRRDAAARFQSLLGVLRAWWIDAGQLFDERLTGLGQGSVRNRVGDQWVGIGPAICHSHLHGDLKQFAQRSKAGMVTSQDLLNALTLNGRANRNSADFFMIHEYATFHFADDAEIHNYARVSLSNGTEKIRGGGALLKIEHALGVSASDQQRLRNSANNLSPLAGGRHAEERHAAEWSLEQQRVFAADLLKLWIETF